MKEREIAVKEKQAAEAVTAMERLKDEHARELRMAEITQQGSIAESESTRDEALKALQEEHASAIKNKEQQFADDIQRLRDEHAAALTAKLDQHRESLQRVKADHASTLATKELEFSDRLELLERRLRAAVQVLHQASEVAIAVGSYLQKA